MKATPALVARPPISTTAATIRPKRFCAFFMERWHPKRQLGQKNFITFAQGDYASSNATLASDGVVYVPSACRSEGHCRVHIVFHGCDQSRAQVGDAVVRETGFADWAETNKIIVLFPQAAASALNPLTCWDWWGYTASISSPAMRRRSKRLSRCLRAFLKDRRLKSATLPPARPRSALPSAFP